MYSTRQITKYFRLLTKSSIKLRCHDFSTKTSLPSSAEVVIVGGGAIGSSIAYHLSKLGINDIVLLEQGSAGCGTSWHAAGLMGSLRGNKHHTQMSLYGIDLLSEQLEKETGFSTGFKKCGSLILAQTDDRALLLQRLAVSQRESNNEVHILTPKEALEKNPLLNIDDLKLALYLPNDGAVNPTDVVQAYQKGAKNKGVQIFEGVKVTGLECNHGNVTAVNTESSGNIACKTFVNAAGLWSRDLGQLSTPVVEVPLHACQHFYVVSNACQAPPLMPVTRDYDACTYTREWSGGLLCGGFEPDALSCFYRGVPDRFEFQLLEENWGQFEFLLEGLLQRYPRLRDAGIREFVNGPESFTPDGMPCVGRSYQLSNYYIASGMSSYGIVGSAAVGRIISEVIAYAESELDHRSLNPNRFPSNNAFYLREAAPQTLSESYAIPYPRAQPQLCRHVMMSPLHHALKENGAVFGQHGLYEVPLFFKREPTEKHEDGFGKPSWIENVREELIAVENSCAIVDLSCKTKFNIYGKTSDELDRFLDEIFDADVRGMTPNDYVTTVIRDQNNHAQSSGNLAQVHQTKYTLIVDPLQGPWVSSWIGDQARQRGLSGNIQVENITGKYASVGLVGPNSEELLNELLAHPTSVDQVASDTCKMVDIGYASRVQLANKPNDVLQWQLFIPSEYAQGFYKLAKEYGKKYGIRDVGLYTLDSLRIGKGVKKVGVDVAYGEGVSQVHEKASTVEIDVTNHKNWPWGGEPVFTNDDVIVGKITSLGYNKDGGAVAIVSGHVTNESKVKVGQDVYKCSPV